MKKRNLVIGLVVTAIVLSSTGCAGKFGKGNFADKMFSKFDDDKDGFVDKTEFFAISTSRFKRTDDNGDSKISKKESQETFIAKRFPSKIKKWFIRNDTNKDGFISSDEMREDSRKEFLAQDINNDSKLSQTEMTKYRNDQRFKSIDTNNDGSISKKEYSNTKTPFSK